MLILYFVRYRLSRCFILLQGNSLQLKQYFEFSLPQFFIAHCKTVIFLSLSKALHPGHLSFSRRYAIQIPQFIPQGAIREVAVSSFINLSWFLCLVLLFIFEANEQGLLTAAVLELACRKVGTPLFAPTTVY